MAIFNGNGNKNDNNYITIFIALNVTHQFYSYKIVLNLDRYVVTPGCCVLRELRQRRISFSEKGEQLYHKRIEFRSTLSPLEVCSN